MKSTYCFCRGPEFGSQYPHQAVHNHLQPQLQRVLTPLVSTGTHIHVHMHTHTHTHTHTHELKIKQILNLERERERERISNFTPVMSGDSTQHGQTDRLFSYSNKDWAMCSGSLCWLQRNSGAPSAGVLWPSTHSCWRDSVVQSAPPYICSVLSTLALFPAPVASVSLSFAYSSSWLLSFLLHTLL